MSARRKPTDDDLLIALFERLNSGRRPMGTAEIKGELHGDTRIAEVILRVRPRPAVADAGRYRDEAIAALHQRPALATYCRGGYSRSCGNNPRIAIARRHRDWRTSEERIEFAFMCATHAKATKGDSIVATFGVPKYVLEKCRQLARAAEERKRLEEVGAKAIAEWLGTLRGIERDLLAAESVRLDIEMRQGQGLPYWQYEERRRELTQRMGVVLFWHGALS